MRRSVEPPLAPLFRGAAVIPWSEGRWPREQLDPVGACWAPCSRQWPGAERGLLALLAELGLMLMW